MPPSNCMTKGDGAGASVQIPSKSACSLQLLITKVTEIESQMKDWDQMILRKCHRSEELGGAF